MRKWITGLLVGLSAAALMVMGVVAAPAPVQPFVITRTPLAAGLGDAARAALSNFFKREQNFLTLQSNYIKVGFDASTRLQQLIAAAKAEGKDTAALEAALVQYNADIGQAQSANTAAASTIIVHAGFDGTGKVIDIQAAYQTVLDARLSLRNAHGLMVQAVTTLRQAIDSWRQTH